MKAASEEKGYAQSAEMKLREIWFVNGSKLGTP